MTYNDVNLEYINKFAAPGFLKDIWGIGKTLWKSPAKKQFTDIARRYGVRAALPSTHRTGFQLAGEFAKRYPVQLAGTGLAGIAGNKVLGNMMYGPRQPGEMSRGALGFGGLL